MQRTLSNRREIPAFLQDILDEAARKRSQPAATGGPNGINARTKAELAGPRTVKLSGSGIDDEGRAERDALLSSRLSAQSTSFSGRSGADAMLDRAEETKTISQSYSPLRPTPIPASAGQVLTSAGVLADGLLGAKHARGALASGSTAPHATVASGAAVIATTVHELKHDIPKTSAKKVRSIDDSEEEGEGDAKSDPHVSSQPMHKSMHDGKSSVAHMTVAPTSDHITSHTLHSSKASSATTGGVPATSPGKGHSAKAKSSGSRSKAKKKKGRRLDDSESEFDDDDDGGSESLSSFVTSGEESVSLSSESDSFASDSDESDDDGSRGRGRARSQSTRTRSSRNSSKPVCQYDGQCYRQNPQHWRDFDHPNQPNGPVSRSSGSAPAAPASSAPQALNNAARLARYGLSVCQYGASCYQRNPVHRSNFYHPGRNQTPPPSPPQSPAPAPPSPPRPIAGPATATAQQTQTPPQPQATPAPPAAQLARPSTQHDDSMDNLAAASNGQRQQRKPIEFRDFFDGIEVFFYESFDASAKDSLSRRVIAHGGQVTDGTPCLTTTHVIFPDGTDASAASISKTIDDWLDKYPDLLTVTVGWLKACFRAGALTDETPFYVGPAS